MGIVRPLPKLTVDVEVCDDCDCPMDTWQTQYIEDGYDYVEFVCQNTDDCGCREDKHLYHNNAHNGYEFLPTYLDGKIMNAETLEDRYNIYVECLKGTGETPKSFDEWLNS